MFLMHGQAGRSIASHAGVFRGARFSSLPGKFCPGISFTICTNQFNLPKNDREGLNPVSKMALKKWITNFRLDIPSGKTGKSFQMFRCSRKFSDGTIQKVYGEGKRRNEFVEWHVAWLREWHNYAECKIWKLAQRNKLNWKACARHCRAFFGANLSEQLLYWFTHLDIYLKHTWELARVPEGSLQTKTLKSGKYSEAWPK